MYVLNVHLAVSTLGFGEQQGEYRDMNIDRVSSGCSRVAQRPANNPILTGYLTLPDHPERIFHCSAAILYFITGDSIV